MLERRSGLHVGILSGWMIFRWVDIPHFVHLFISWWTFTGFCLWAILWMVLPRYSCASFVWTPVLNSLGHLPTSGIAESYDNFLTFGGTTNFFSSAAVPFYILSSRVRVPISPYLYKHLLFLWFFKKLKPSQWVWSGSSLWYRFAFSWWLLVLSIFSCSSWPFVYLLWRNTW